MRPDFSGKLKEQFKVIQASRKIVLHHHVHYVEEEEKTVMKNPMIVYLKVLKFITNLKNKRTQKLHQNMSVSLSSIHDVYFKVIKNQSAVTFDHLGRGERG